MSVALAVQKAIRERLIGTPGVITLVPAPSILDSHQRPAPSPSIMLGEAQVVDDRSSMDRKRWRVFHTLHIWKREPSLQGVADISWQIKQAIHAARLQLDGFHCGDARVADTRAMRDPDGETSHGIVSLDVLVEETA